MYVGKKIKQLRLGLDLNQTEMADKLGVSQPYYSAVESGKKPITNRMLTKLNVVFSIDISYFTENIDSKSYNNNGGSKSESEIYLVDRRKYHKRMYEGFEIKKDSIWKSQYDAAMEKLGKIEFYYQRIVDVKEIMEKQLPNITVGSKPGGLISFEKKIIDNFGGELIDGAIRSKYSTTSELRTFNNELFDLINILDLRFFELFRILYNGLMTNVEIPDKIN